MGNGNKLLFGIVALGVSIACGYAYVQQISTKQQEKIRTREGVLELLEQIRSASSKSYETIKQASRNSESMSKAEKIKLVVACMEPISELQGRVKAEYHVGEIEFDQIIAKYADDVEITKINNEIMATMSDIRDATQVLMR